MLNKPVPLALMLLLLPGTALAEELNGANTAWILTATALVLFMTMPGLALFYGGLVRSKNVLSVMAQCSGIAFMASILWVVCLYSLAFKGGNGGWIGNLDAEEPRANRARDDDRREQTGERADDDQPQSLTENEPGQGAWRGTDGRAYRDLAAAHHDRQRQHAVDPAEREDAGDDRETDQQLHRKIARHQ